MFPSVIWIISLPAIAGVILRPFKIPEVVWAVAGAAALLIARSIDPSEAWTGVKKGTDVYLFLTGMMLLAETAREEKLFDWLAAHATRLSRGSSFRLFGLIYFVGMVVTVFLSNDATAVVLTPAVAAAVKAARVKNPLPFLFICAFVANAASFVLPISNPANLVIYGRQLPPLLLWLPKYLLPSVVSVTVTFFVLRLTQAKSLREPVVSAVPFPALGPGGKGAIAGIGLTALVLGIASALDLPLGLPTALTGVATSLVVLGIAKKSAIPVLRGVSWSVIPLVAALFVIVEAINKTGFAEMVSARLAEISSYSVVGATWATGIVTALAGNLMNNLPAGLIAGSVVQTGLVPELVKSAALIGIDLGPNLSITGSLATMLWLVALRREGITVRALTFLKLGAVVMTSALLLSLAALWI